jgi:hypothetical protein
MERTRGDGSVKQMNKETIMTRYKTQAVATLAFALLTVPAFADDWGGINGTSQNGMSFNSLTSNAIFANGTGLYALNGVRVEGIVLAKSTGPAARSVVDPNDRSLPAVQKGGVEKSIVDPNDRSRPAGKKSTAGKSVIDPND